MRTFAVILAFVTGLSLLSCSKPEIVESYRLVSQKENGMYRFEVDMTDSLSCYDIDIFARVDGKLLSRSFPLDIEWTSPSGARYGERVFFNQNAERHREAFSIQLRDTYRRNIVPVESGIWKLGIAADTPGLRGMGVIFTCHEDKWDTTN